MSLNLEVPYNQAAGLYLPLTGGALTGPLALGANKITGLANGTAATDAATFGQMQTTEAALNPALEYNDLLGWTLDPTSATTTSAVMAYAATIELCRIPLPAAITVTNVLAYLGIIGVTLTHSFLALFKSDGTIIGQTADQSTPWHTTLGLYTLPLVGGPYVCTPLAANDFLWAAMYVGTAGTLPAFAATNSAALMPLYNAGTSVARSRVGAISQSDRATLVSITPSGINNANSNYSYWMGIS
jgi:hypothetical protein